MERALGDEWRRAGDDWPLRTRRHDVFPEVLTGQRIHRHFARKAFACYHIPAGRTRLIGQPERGAFMRAPRTNCDIKSVDLNRATGEWNTG
jgi:hypothetical protein